MRCILALDQGTTGSTALVISPEGQVIGRGYREIPQYFPHPGEVEHDAEDLFRCTIEAGRQAQVAAGDPVIDAIGISNQRETVVLWDSVTLQAVGRAIVWQDRRTTARCKALQQAGWAPLLRARTGLLLDPYFSATKLEWMLAQPEVQHHLRRGTLRTGTVESWLITRLTGGVHVTDPTNASRTMLASLADGHWDPELLELFGVPEAILPQLVPSAGVVGIARAEWFGREIPIAGLAGDQQAALFGQGCVTPGSAKVTFGTGAFLLRYVGNQSPPKPTEGVLATIAVGAKGETSWAVEGSLFVAGAAVQWLRDSLGLIVDASETAALAAAVTDTGGVALVPAFTGLGAPWWEARTRGMVTGITRGTSKAHLVRATLESIAQGTADLIQVMGEITSLRVDGGVSRNDWLMQFLADLLDVPVERPAVVDLTPWGAARLAALGIGGELPSATQLGGIQYFQPTESTEWRRQRRREWGRAVRAALTWARDDETD